jgi:hypothetical protein
VTGTIARIVLIAASSGLCGCAWQAAFDPRPGAQLAPVTQPAPASTARLEMRNGQLVAEPLTPTEIVIEGLGQAQRIRTLTRQLSR